jgi:hypothetical protein
MFGENITVIIGLFFMGGLFLSGMASLIRFQFEEVRKLSSCTPTLGEDPESTN